MTAPVTSAYEFWNRVTESQADYQKGGGPFPRTLAVHGALNHELIFSMATWPERPSGR